MVNKLAVWGWIAIFTSIIPFPGHLVGLSEELKLGDLFNGLVFLIIVILLPLKKTITKPKPSLLFILFMIYIMLVLLLPLLGIIIYNYPLDVYFGDLRWLQVIAVFLFFLIIYNKNSKSYTAHAYIFIWCLILFQIPFIISQANVSIFGVSPNFLLRIWFEEMENVYGYHGVLLNRFAGSFSGPSNLALIGGVGFLSAGLKLTNKFNKLNSLLLILSASIIIASGSRTMMFGAPAGLFFCIFILTLSTKYNRSVILRLAYLGLIISIVGISLYNFDVGRIASQNRLQSVIDVITGDRGYQEVSDRGIKRWSSPLKESFRGNRYFGTLANPSHVLDSDEPLDSYYVFTIAQAGPFILLSFIILLFFQFYYGFIVLIGGYQLGPLILATTIVLFIYSFTANLMTALTGRYILLLGVTSILLPSNCHRRKPT